MFCMSPSIITARLLCKTERHISEPQWPTMSALHLGAEFTRYLLSINGTVEAKYMQGKNSAFAA
jgi:hypothetical protein